MTEMNTFQCQTVNTLPEQLWDRFVSLTLQADGGSTALVAGDALPPEPFPGTGGGFHTLQGQAAPDHSIHPLESLDIGLSNGHSYP